MTFNNLWLMPCINIPQLERRMVAAQHTNLREFT